MARSRYDDILNDLGLGDSDSTPAKKSEEAGDSQNRAARPGDDSTAGERTGADETIYSPLPSVPVNQKLYGEEAEASPGRTAEPAKSDESHGGGRHSSGG